MTAARREVGTMIRDLRPALGWRQRTLARRAGVSQSWVCAVERGGRPDVSFDSVDRLLVAMGATMLVDVKAPFLSNPRQRDAVHARWSSFVARRLERAGRQVATEVEVGDDRSRGWIDVLACHPGTGLILVIEIKTEMRDLGAIERSLGWYEREAWAAGRRMGWRPQRMLGCLIALATESVDQRVRDNREPLAHGFPIRAKDLGQIIVTGQPLARGLRGLALIDPRSRRNAWLRPARVDGRRSPAPYVDYADFVRKDLRRRAA
jgi:transcriptional regulator with XRE-family HTH domain